MDEEILNKLKGDELFQIVIGTYEEYLLGYSLFFNKNLNKFQFNQKFTNHAHSGSIKTIACSQNGFLVSGSIDETCHIINLKKNVEVGNLIEQQGAILDLVFYENKYLFSVSEDSTICVWDTKTWICEKKFSGHKSDVNSITIHPSGKLMFSISKDKTIRTWNLITGRIAFVTNLKEIPNQIRFCQEDKNFLVIYNKHIDVYDLTLCGIFNTLELDTGISCVKCLKNNLIIIGTESGKIFIYNYYEKTPKFSFEAHNRRVKGIQEIPYDLVSIKKTQKCICTISSDGYLKLWKLNDENFELLAKENTNCRPNCIAFYSKNLETENSKNNLEQNN